MQLINHLYYLKSRNIESSKATFRVAFNAEHFIYKAHFPNNPITPGVCLIQMLVEIFEEWQDRKFAIRTLKNVKFTAPINPLEVPEANVLIEFSENENNFHLRATVEENDVVFTKISMVVA